MRAGAWIETERQGRGRRYWFRSRRAAAAFARERAATGRHAFQAGRTVWVSYGRRVTADVRAVAAGIDVWGGQWS